MGSGSSTEYLAFRRLPKIHILPSQSLPPCVLRLCCVAIRVKRNITLFMPARPASQIHVLLLTTSSPNPHYFVPKNLLLWKTGTRSLAKAFRLNGTLTKSTSKLWDNLTCKCCPLREKVVLSQRSLVSFPYLQGSIMPLIARLALLSKPIPPPTPPPTPSMPPILLNSEQLNTTGDVEAAMSRLCLLDEGLESGIPGLTSESVKSRTSKEQQAEDTGESTAQECITFGERSS